MAKKGTAKAKTTVKIVESPVEVNEFVQEEIAETIEETKQEEKASDEPKKEWVKDYRELVAVEGVNQTQRGKEYYGVKRKS